MVFKIQAIFFIVFLIIALCVILISSGYIGDAVFSVKNKFTLLDKCISNGNLQLLECIKEVIYTKIER